MRTRRKAFLGRRTFQPYLLFACERLQILPRVPCLLLVFPFHAFQLVSRFGLGTHPRHSAHRLQPFLWLLVFHHCGICGRANTCIREVGRGERKQGGGGRGPREMRVMGGVYEGMNCRGRGYEGCGVQETMLEHVLRSSTTDGIPQHVLHTDMPCWCVK